MILRYPEYPSVLYITNNLGFRLKVLELNKDLLVQELKPGFTVERQLINNDSVIVNRQPTLHKLSMMCHKVKVHDNKTVGLNPCVCPPYNADFDGDEMNIHVLQETIAEVESRYLMGVQNNIISSKNGKPCIGAIKDVLIGLYLITSSDKNFSWDQLSYILTGIDITNLKVYSNLSKNITGKQIISLIFPEDFEFYHQSNNQEILIEKGELKYGVFDKNIISVNGILLERFCKKYPNKIGSNLINDFIKLSLNFLKIFGLTYSYKDNIITNESKLEIEKITKDYSLKLKNLSSVKQTMQVTISKQKLLNQLRDSAGKITLSQASNTDLNPVLLMSKAGSSGTELNFIQVNANLGLQTYSDKRNVNAYGDYRTYALEIPDILQKNQYIKSSYSKGLNSYEFFEQACAAREAEIDVYVKTSSSGYLQRRLINCMNDIYIDPKGVVRDSYDKIVQFICGGNNIDFRKISKSKPFIDLDLLGILQIKNIESSKISETLHQEFIDKLSTKLKLLPNILVKGISAFCLTYQYTPQDVNILEDKIIQEIKYYQYDAFQPLGIVSAQSIGEPATQMTLKSIHVSGIAELRLNSGLERLIELLNATHKIKTPYMTFYLKSKQLSKKNQVLSKIANIIIPEICDIIIDLENLFITIIFKENKFNITYNLVYNTIKSKITGIDLTELTDSKIRVTPKVLSYYELNKVYTSLNKLKLSGISKLQNIIVGKTKLGYKITTQGSNLKQTHLLFGQDSSLEFESNDIYQIYSIYGLETARYYLVKQIYSVMKRQGLDVSITHLELVADTMTLYGLISPIGRTGVIKYKKSTIAKAAFETAGSFIIDASLKHQVDHLKGVFENSLLGKNINLGTERINLKYDRKTD
jgi:DNA-directed RNA polymerase subunit A'